MKKLKLFLIIPVVFLLLAGKVYSAGSVAGHKVVLDPGHGGADTGTTECSTMYEKDANLKVALILQQMLQNAGAKVYMTRITDTYLTNSDRYNFANSTGAEALVSIHMDGATNHNIDGTEALYGKKNKDFTFAKSVHTSQVTDLVLPDLGVTNFADGVLLKSNMPATLTESIFLSNIDECQQMSDGTNTRETQIAQSIFDGLNNWFSRQ